LERHEENIGRRTSAVSHHADDMAKPILSCAGIEVALIPRPLIAFAARVRRAADDGTDGETVSADPPKLT
jgi:hypothetical protein